MDEKEKEILKLISQVYILFSELPSQHPNELNDFADGVHQLQYVMGMRCARKCCPDVFPLKGELKLQDKLEEQSQENTKKVDWINKDGEKFSFDQISDQYLYNIVNYLNNGNSGYNNFVTEEVVENLFKELEKREIQHKFDKKGICYLVCSPIYIEEEIETEEEILDRSYGSYFDSNDWD